MNWFRVYTCYLGIPLSSSGTWLTKVRTARASSAIAGNYKRVARLSLSKEIMRISTPGTADTSPRAGVASSR